MAHSKLIALAVLLMNLTVLSAQNSLFLSFGQTESEVKGYFEKLDYGKKDYQYQNGVLSRQVSSNRQVSYTFKNEVLYSIEDIRTYADKKEADMVVESCLEFIKLAAKKPAQLDNKEVDNHYAAVMKDRIIELLVNNDKKTSRTTITLKTISRSHGPVIETEGFAKHIKRSNR